MDGNDRLGMLAAVQGAEAQDVAGTVQVRDAIAAEAGGNDGLEHAVVDDVEAGGFAVCLVEDLTWFERAGRQGQSGWDDAWCFATARRLECFERVEHG